MSIFESYESESEYGQTPLRAWELAGEGEQYEDEGEALELELTHELLAVSSEAELDRFLGDLVKGAGKFLNSGVGKAVGGVLKNVAKVALPAAGAALGSALLPGVGTAIGGKLGSLAGGLLEVGEAEMMGEAEAQFEAAHRFVQFGRATARNAAMAPPNTPPKAVAKAAATAAARKHAPGLLRPQTFRDRRADRRQPGRRPSDQQAGRRQRPSQSHRGQPPRRRPSPPWQWGQWQPGQWQPSDAWLGWAPEPGGASPAGAPWDQADSYAGGDGDGAGGNGGAGSVNGGGGDDRGDSSEFEFE
jgi:hypothetical protein